MIDLSPKCINFLIDNNLPYSYEGEVLTVLDRVIKVETIYSWISKSKKYNLSPDQVYNVIKYELSFDTLKEYTFEDLVKYNILNTTKLLYHKKLKKHGLLGTWITGEKWKVQAIGREDLGERILTREAINTHIKKKSPIEHILIKTKTRQSITGEELQHTGIITHNQLELYNLYQKHGVNIKFGDSPPDFVKIEVGGESRQISTHRLRTVKHGLETLQTSSLNQVEWLLQNYTPSYTQFSKQDLEYCIQNNITSSYIFTFNLARKYIPQVEYIVHGHDDVELFYNGKSLRGNRLLIQDRLYTRKGWKEILTSRYNFYSSQFEQEVENFLVELGVNNFQKNVRTIKGISELDFLILDHNIAIECNGVYYHSTLFKSKDYHQQKTLDCKNKDINLIHIWEDQWMNKNSIIKSILRNKLASHTQTKIYARKCTVKVITKRQAYDFLSQNHLSGYSVSKYHFGLSYKDKLVSVISLSKNRKFLNGNQWELVRYASLLNTNVIGGFSKLLSFASKTLQMQECISYVDYDIYNGDGYKKIGFEFIKLTPPGYYFVSGDLSHRKHRYNFTRQVLLKRGFSKDQSVDEITGLLKYRKIYNSGNLLFKKVF